MESQNAFPLEMHAKLLAPVDVGPSPEGHRLVIHAGEGQFKGRKMSGTAVPSSGGDWASIRLDETFAPDIRIYQEADDGAFIYATYGGCAVAKSPEQLVAILDLFSSDSVDPDEHYFRTNTLIRGDRRCARLKGVVSNGRLRRRQLPRLCHRITGDEFPQTLPTI